MSVRCRATHNPAWLYSFSDGLFELGFEKEVHCIFCRPRKLTVQNPGGALACTRSCHTVSSSLRVLDPVALVADFSRTGRSARHQQHVVIIISYWYSEASETNNNRYYWSCK